MQVPEALVAHANRIIEYVDAIQTRSHKGHPLNKDNQKWLQNTLAEVTDLFNQAAINITKEKHANFKPAPHTTFNGDFQVLLLDEFRRHNHILNELFSYVRYYVSLTSYGHFQKYRVMITI